MARLATSAHPAPASDQSALVEQPLWVCPGASYTSLFNRFIMHIMRNCGVLSPPKTAQNGFVLAGVLRLQVFGCVGVLRPMQSRLLSCIELEKHGIFLRTCTEQLWRCTVWVAAAGKMRLSLV